MFQKELARLRNDFPEIIRILQAVGYKPTPITLNQRSDGQLGQFGQHVPYVCFSNKHKEERKLNIDIFVLDKGQGQCMVEYRYLDRHIPTSQEPTINRLSQDRASFDIAQAVRKMK